MNSGVDLKEGAYIPVVYTKWICEYPLLPTNFEVCQVFLDRCFFFFLLFFLRFERLERLERLGLLEIILWRLAWHWGHRSIRLLNSFPPPLQRNLMW